MKDTRPDDGPDRRRTRIVFPGVGQEWVGKLILTLAGVWAAYMTAKIEKFSAPVPAESQEYSCVLMRTTPLVRGNTAPDRPKGNPHE